MFSVRGGGKGWHAIFRDKELIQSISRLTLIMLVLSMAAMILLGLYMYFYGAGESYQTIDMISLTIIMFMYSLLIYATFRMTKRIP
jgi:hypothetical protein